MSLPTVSQSTSLSHRVSVGLVVWKDGVYVKWSLKQVDGKFNMELRRRGR